MSLLSHQVAMAKRFHPSDLDFSDFTWEMVFKEAGISEDTDIAQRSVVPAFTPLVVHLIFLLIF